MKKLLLLSLLIINFNAFTADYSVKMLNQGSSGVMVFEPAVLKINKGDTVNFISTDAAHNSASLPGMIPTGATSWSSELSQDISVTFDIEGLYAYQCTPHAVMAMVGVIQVGENPSNLNQVMSQAENMKPMFLMNKDRLTDYISQL
ncbi:MAG: pseudoazurin [SAR86 cluster bacterium]|uniref:Pseudoazurin n=1 Tax=SAR86 cluster bacterium TaxID=2030880 RepID=A0A937M2E5_9GAMM|nr:pseudoazurin [SAR86 cluster bacterium]